MQKIIEVVHKPTPVYDYFCDFKGESEKAYNKLEIEGWYGSDIDLEKYTFELSNEALQEVLNFIRGKLKNSKLEDHCKMIYFCDL